MKKILCIGSAGFILGNFVRKIIYGHKESYALVSIDNLTNGDFNTIYTNRYHTFYPADVRDHHILDRIFEKEKPDYVIYAASIEQSDYIYSDEIHPLENVLTACKKYKVEKFIYLSSDTVYDQSNNPREEDYKLVEMKLPFHPYGTRKLLEENMIKAECAENTSMTYNILRLGNTYGNWDRSEKFISKSIRSILNEQPIVIHGDGSQARDWTYIFDTVSAIMFLLEKGQPNEIYNVGAGQEFSVLEVAHMICSTMNKGFNLLTFDKSKVNNLSRALNTNKLKALGWKSNFKLKDGLGEAVQWYSNNSFLFKLKGE